MLCGMFTQDPLFMPGEAAHNLQEGGSMASKGLGSAKVTLNCPVFYTSQCWQLPWLASWPALNGTSLGGGEMTVFEAKKKCTK